MQSSQLKFLREQRYIIVMMLIQLLAEANTSMGASPMQASNDELHDIELVIHQQGTLMLQKIEPEPSAGGLMCLRKVMPALAVLRIAWRLQLYPLSAHTESCHKISSSP